MPRLNGCRSGWPPDFLPSAPLGAQSSGLSGRRPREPYATRPSRGGALHALGVAALGYAILLTGLLAAGSASAQTSDITTPTANADGSDTLWTATLTVGTINRGAVDQFGIGTTDYGSLSSRTFTIDGTAYYVTHLYYGSGPHGTLQFADLAVDLPYGFPAEQSRWALHLDEAVFYGSDDIDISSSILEWENFGLTWTDEQEVAVKLVRLNAPTAPSNLRASAASSGRIDLSWSAPAKTGGADITGYKVEVSTDNGNNWTDLVTDTTSTDTTYSHAGLSSSSTYHYRVSAINAIGTSPVSNTASATTASDITTPTANADGSDTLWTATLTVGTINRGAVDQFGIGTTDYGSLSSRTFTIDGTAYYVTHLYYGSGTFGTLQFADLVADFPIGFPAEQSRWALHLDGAVFYGSDDIDISSSVLEWENFGLTWTDEQEVAVKLVRLNKPTAPSNLGASAASSGRIDLSWSAPAKTGGADITGYKVEVSTDNGNNWTDLVTDTTSTDTTYSHAGLSSSSTYHYRVSAINAIGTSPVSNTASATTASDITTPTANADGSDTLWTATLTVGTINRGAVDQFGIGTTDYGSLSSRTFTIDGTAYYVTHLYYGSGTFGTLQFADLVADFPIGFPAEQSRWALHLDGAVFYGSDDIDISSSVLEWENFGLTWTDEQEVAVKLVRLNAPTAPSNLRASAASSGRVELSWSAPAKTGGADITGYKVEVSTDNGNNWTDLVTDTTSTDTTYSHAGLSSSSTYHYRVSAINAIGTSPVSNTASATTASDITTPTANADGSDTLWTATLTVGAINRGAVDQFGIGTTDYGSLSSRTFTIDGTAYYVTHLYYGSGTFGTLQFADLVADLPIGFPAEQSRWALHLDEAVFYGSDDIDISSSVLEWENFGLTWTDEQEVAVKLVRLNAPTVPRNLHAKGDSNTEIDLTWRAPFKTGGSDVTGYRIEVSTDGGDNWSDLVADTASTDTTYSHIGLTMGDTRHYRVSAINSIGTSPESNVASATATATPPGLARAVVERTNSLRVRLEFDEPVETTSISDKSAFSVNIEETPAEVTGFTIEDEGSGTGSLGWLDLAASVGPGETVTLSYTKPNTNPIKDTANNEMVSFADYAVTNETSHAFPELSVPDEEVHESGNGMTSTMTFTVRVDTEPEFPVGVHYETEDGTATGGASCTGTSPPDYVSTSGRLTLGPGASSQVVEVTICDDNVVDGGETFRLVLRSTQLHESIDELGEIGPEGKSYKNANGEDEETASATGTILNSESDAVVSIVADTTYGEEGSDAVFTLRRAGDAETELTVPVTVEETGAMLDGDAPESVTFAAESREVELRIATEDDGVDETDSKVTATVQAGATWHLAEEASSAELTVLDNDTAPVTSTSATDVTIWSANMKVVEYGTGVIGAGSADLFSNQTGSSGLLAKWLWYDPAARELKIAFDDGLDDAESMTLHVGDLSVGFPENSGGDSSFTLEDVDVAWTDGATVAVRVSNPSAAAVSTDATLASLIVEGSTLSPAFEAGVLVYRTAVDAEAETVTVTATATDDGGATVTYGPAEDADTELADHQVSLPEGETLVAVTVTAADGKTVRSYRVVVTRARAPVAIAFGATAYTATEGGDSATVAVTLAADPERTVTVPLVATPEGGAAAADFEAPLAVTFERGAGLTQTVTVTAVADEDAEDGERVALGFGTLPEGLVAGEPASTTVTLVDAPPNAAPTGLPAISGTAEVGETLTASVAAIEDADGLTGASFAYQWVANNGTADADLADATQETYTVAAEDAGKTLMVRVTFTDDRGTEETLVSEATDAVVVPLTATFEAVPDEHDGASVFTFRVRFNIEPRVGFRVLRDESFAVTGGTVKKARRVNGRNDLREIHVEPSGMGDITVTLAGGRACGTEGAICTADDKVLSNTETAMVQGPPALSVADARAEEGVDATIEFVVTLSRVAAGPVTVAYATTDGTAQAGQDYTATSGTLTFTPGVTTHTVAVPVLDDAHDDTEETFTLTLSTPSGAWLEDGEATGTIRNSDAIPTAWLARFGRTVATHVTDAVTDRLWGTPGQASHLTVGGYRLPVGPHPAGGAEREAEPGAEAGTEPNAKANSLTSLVTEVAGAVLGLGGSPGSGGPGSDPPAGQDPRLGRSRTLNVGETFDLRTVLLGSSFRLALGADDDARPGALRLTAWGRVAGTQFDGRDGTLSLDGDVLTGTLGVDSEWDRWLAGVAVSHSRGDGSFTMPGTEARGQGDLDQTLTSIHPYLRYAVTDRLDVWGVLGYGWGALTVAPGTGVSMETDTHLLMGAFGGRGILLSPEESGGFQLATRTDAMLTRTSSEAVAGLKSADADAHRLRLVLEGSRGFTWAEGRTMTPSVELGLRHDWGDAETGFGLELGGRVQYADPALGLTIDGAVRALLAHEDDDYEEWGAWGTIRVAPGAGGQGLSLTLSPTWGAASSGVDGLWSRQTTAGLAPQGTRQAPAGRLTAEAGYGVPLFDTGVLTPYAGTVLSDGSDRTWRVGTRLQLADRWAGLTELNVEGVQQASAGQHPVTGLRLQATWGAGSRGFTTLTLDGQRQPATGVQPGNQGLQLQVTWGF